MTPLKSGFGPLASAAEARAAILNHCRPSPAEDVALSDLHGRVLAADVIATIDVPHFAKSSMDGYAVVASDTARASEHAPVRLELQAEISTGQWAGSSAEPGMCVEIGTGAAVPDGYDAVVMVERTLRDGRSISVMSAVDPGENIIPAGSDIPAGSVAMRKGTRADASHLGIIAALGLEKVTVAARPRVALISTGPELLAPGTTLEKGKIFEINSFTLRAALSSDGADAVDYGVVPDHEERVSSAIQSASKESDLVVVSGGTSLGAGDLVVEAFNELGNLLVHGVRVKPGKPLAVALTPQGKLLIGLPGFPVSALCDYYLFGRPLIKAMTGVVDPAFSSKAATLARRHESPGGFHEFRLVRLEGDLADPIYRGSSEISAFAEADGYFEVDEETEVLQEGQTVEVMSF